MSNRQEEDKSGKGRPWLEILRDFVVYEGGIEKKTLLGIRGDNTPIKPFYHWA